MRRARVNRRRRDARRRRTPLVHPGLGVAHRLRALCGVGAPVKAARGEVEKWDMALRDLSCPVCNADFPLAGDEKKGEEVFCTYCGAPCRLTAAADDEDVEVEEDF